VYNFVQKFPCIAVISTKVVGGDFFLVHMVEQYCCSWSSMQPAVCHANNVLVVRNFVSFHQFSQFMIKQKSLGARTTYLITRPLKHLLPSKMPTLNYSATHRIRHSYSYCTANGWLEEQEQQFFYNRIRALEKCWTRCILVAEEYVKKSQNTICIFRS